MPLLLLDGARSNPCCGRPRSTSLNRPSAGRRPTGIGDLGEGGREWRLTMWTLDRTGGFLFAPMYLCGQDRRIPVFKIKNPNDSIDDELLSSAFQCNGKIPLKRWQLRDDTSCHKLDG